jgi:hypothetical protein
VRRCLHELDVVKFSRSASGFGPNGDPVTVAAGMAGTVVREHAGSPWLEIEVGTPDGTPFAFVEVERDAVEMLHPLHRVTR